MNQPMEIFALACLTALTAGVRAQPLPADWPLGARIPAISGQILDAVTGKPLAGIDVTLRALSASATFFGSGEKVLRYENNRTSQTGQFRFATSLEEFAALPLTTIKEYWLSVNRTFWSPAWMKAQRADLSDPVDSTLADMTGDVAPDPLFRTKVTRHFEFSTPGARVNNKGYFPMAVKFRRPCAQQWNANCVNFEEAQNLRILLIPVLDNPADCARITDAAVREQCRQLNTYRAAFLHADTIAEVHAGRVLCGQVDQGPGSKACLKSLSSYILYPQSFTGRVPLPMEIEPDAAMLILAPIAGMAVTEQRHWGFDPVYDTGFYLACYSADRSQPHAACVTVALAPSEESRNAARDRLLPMGSAEAGSGSEFWISKDKAVAIVFERTGAVLPPERQQELIRQYRSKYPPALP